MNELKQADLLMDGEVSIQQQGNDQPFVYRGFKMVDQEKLRDLRGDARHGGGHRLRRMDDFRPRENCLRLLKICHTSPKCFK